MQWSSLCEDKLIYNSLKFQHDQKLFKDINSGHHLFSNAFWIQMNVSVQNYILCIDSVLFEKRPVHWTHPTPVSNIEKTQHKKFSTSTTKRRERLFPLLSLQHSCQADERISTHSDWLEAPWHHRDRDRVSAGRGEHLFWVEPGRNLFNIRRIWTEKSLYTHSDTPIKPYVPFLTPPSRTTKMITRN